MTAAAAARAALPAAGAGASLRAAWGSAVAEKARVIVVLLVVWELAARFLGINPLVFPAASTVLATWWRVIATGQIFPYVQQSLFMLVSAMAIATAIALVLVAAAVMSRTGRTLLETLTAMFNPLPAIALLPLALLWLGLGPKSLLFVLVHSVLWPLSLNAYTGFITVPPTLIHVGQNMGLRGWRLVWGILLPAAFPFLLTGLKIGWAFAWRTVIAAELVFGVTGSKGGLGWYIYKNRFELNTPEVFAGLLTIIAIGLLVESLVFRTAERRTVLRWGMQQAREARAG